jgi:hypothetical protein
MRPNLPRLSSLVVAGVLACRCASPDAHGAGSSALDAACVDAIADTRLREDELFGPTDLGPISISDAPDLDGDGVEDMLVDAEGYCGSGGCRHAIYLRRGACGIYLGELGANEVVTTGPRHHGLADIEGTLYAGSIDWGEYRASVHDDGRYRIDLSRDCHAVGASANDEQKTLCSPWSPPAELSVRTE